MTFKQDRKRAGFPTQQDFADYVGRTREAVNRWGDDPPLWAMRIIELKLEIKDDTHALAEKYK